MGGGGTERHVKKLDLENDTQAYIYTEREGEKEREKNR